MGEVAISVIVPAFNEEANIAGRLLEIDKCLTRAKLSHEIVLVDDGSIDRTAAVAREIAEGCQGVSVISYSPNRGKGAAFREGLTNSRGRYVAVVDADPEVPAEILLDLVRAIESTNAQAAIGSKRHPMTRLNYPRKRAILSRGFNLMVRILLGLHISDTQLGMKIYDGDTVRRIQSSLKADGFAGDVEMLVSLTSIDARIVEVPVTAEFQEARLGRVNMRNVLSMLLETLSIWGRMHFPSRKHGKGRGDL